MRRWSFTKGHGTENDFVLVLDRDGMLDIGPATVRFLCDRHAGIGADGLLRVVHAGHIDGWTGDPSLWFMDYRNADGSLAEMCGNGIRVFARYLVDAGLAAPGEININTRDGVKQVRLGDGGDVTVDMGVARFPGPDTVTVGVESRVWPATSVDMGNPHAVAFVAALADVGDLCASPVVDPTFPDGVNIEFVVRHGERHLAMRVHERGVGETRSCGTGACAAMVAAARADGAPAASSYIVDVPGGRLTVATRVDGHVELTGPAVIVASGELDESLLA
jgi:diaminopimelate epimerase